MTFMALVLFEHTTNNDCESKIAKRVPKNVKELTGNREKYVNYNKIVFNGKK